MVDVGFFGKPVPLAGARRPVRAPASARAPSPEIRRLSDGRYVVTNWMRNRCENLMQVGATTIYVVNDYGCLVPVDSWEARC